MYEAGLVHVVESSAVKLQMVGSGSPSGWWSINATTRPPPPHQLPSSLFAASSWNHTQDQLPDSWSQLLLGGLAGEDDKHALSCMQPKYLQNWDQQSLDFSPQSKHSHQQLPLSDQCKSTVTIGGATKKARIQPSSAKTTLKVRKEKVGDRITALHQLVSPFGKTDTASVLLEAIGYIKFLQNQIEALSLPYLDSASGIMRQQHPMNIGKCIKRKGVPDDHLDCDHEEPKKDLKSRGLCLVPISCTLDVGSDNIGADYWAPAFGANFR